MDISIRNQAADNEIKKPFSRSGGRSEEIKDSFADYFNRDRTKNPYFMLSKDGGATVSYNNVTFFCNIKTGALELGDCSNPASCIRVPLEKGGSLLFNADSMGGVKEAIGMFSAEDQGRIMRAIQMYNMAKDKLDEIEEDKNSDPEEAASDIQKEAASDEIEKNNLNMSEKMDRVILREMTPVYEIYDIYDIDEPGTVRRTG